MCTRSQSAPRRGRSMLRFAILVLLTCRPRCAHVTTSPSRAERLYQLYTRLENLNIEPIEPKLQKTPQELLYEKLEQLNSLRPDKYLTDDDEELLNAVQKWGMLTPDQMEEIVQELQSVKEEQEYLKSERLADDDSDMDDDDLPEDYPMDWYHDEEPEAGTTRPVTPSAFTRLGPDYAETVVSAVDPIAATNERPKIMDDSLTPMEKLELRRAVFSNIAAVLKTGRCSTPQPRWLTVRQLAPAANIVYMPPCVQLHRCAPDSGCCYDESEVCAPVSGNYVAIPFYLQKADGERSMARMLFFNHTQCACVSRETLQTTVRTRVDAARRDLGRDMREESREIYADKQNDWRASTEEPSLEKEDDTTDPPQLRRCTCPSLFMARTVSERCACVCAWPAVARRRDCLSQARGREHFGLRDRVCVDRGHCAPPACDFGAYDRALGRCPPRPRRRYHNRSSPTSDVPPHA